MADMTSRHERMSVLNEMIGMTMRHLQLLEGSVAQFFVLTEKAEQGMGEEKGNVLLAKAQRDTFGGSVKKLIAARSLPDDVTGRFEALVKERNWLVHNSLEENRKASINDGCFEAFLLRLEAMVNETNALMRELLVRAEEFVLSRGVRADQIEAKTAETLKLWRG
jgi:hypothetical protein